MKKVILVLSLIGFFSLSIGNAQDITVADGTDRLLYAPISAYSWGEAQQSQSIYPDSLLSELRGKYITGLTWYPTANLATGWIDPQTQTISIGITNATNLNNGLVSGNTSVVWTGQLPLFFEADSIRIPFDIPFFYDGGNLLIEIVKGRGADSYYNERFYGQNQPNILTANQIGTYYPPYLERLLPKVTFRCANGLCSNPENLQVSDISPESAQLSWTPSRLGSAESYVVAYRSNIETEFTEVTVSDTFVTLTGLHPITAYTWKVKAVCSDTLSSMWSMENTYTTQRRKATIPYFCDFEDSTENVNWVLPINPDAENNRWYIGTYVSCSGNSSMYVSSNNGATNLMYGFSGTYPAWAYREFTIDTLYPQYQITFKHRGYDHHTAYWGPTATLFGFPLVLQPAGSIRLSNEQSIPEDDTWKTHTYTFNVATTGIYRLYFDWRTALNYNSGLSAASIDDISIVGIPCVEAHALTTTDITDSSATISWEYNCVNTPMGYQIGYKTASDYNYTVFTVYDTTAITLTGLHPYTTYYWRVKTLFDNDFSTDWSSEANFQTDVVWVHPIPYTCDFEDAAENHAWNVPVFSGNNQNRWYIGHNTYYSSNTSLYITTAANGSNNTYMSLAEGQLWTYRDIYLDPQYSGYVLSFDAKVRGSSNYAFAQLFVGDPVNPTNSSAADSMVLIDHAINSIYVNDTVMWRHFEYFLDNTFVGHKRLFFMWQNHSSSFTYSPAIAIDNIAVSGTQCSHPSQLAYTAADTTAVLTWQNSVIGSPYSYTVAYKSETDSVFTMVEVLETTLTIGGLQPLTNYNWKVRANCSDEEHSDWAEGQDFMTYSLLSTMPYACDFEDSLTNASWNSHSTAANLKWCIGSAVQNEGQYSSYISADNGASHQTINPISATAYMFQDFLFSTDYSEYVLEFDFKTFDTTPRTDISVYVVSPTSPHFTMPDTSTRAGQVHFTDTLWHHVSLLVNRTHSGIQRLILEWKKEDNNVEKGSCAVDNVTFNGITVGRPYALTSSNVRHDSALLAWNSGNRLAPVYYQLAFRKADDTTFTILTCSDTVKQLGALTPHTLYYWKVRAVADNNEMSFWSDEATFNTESITPFYTGFEDESDWLYWHVSSTGMLDKWIIGNAVNCDSVYSLYISSDDGVTNSSIGTYYSDSICIYRDIYLTPGAEEYQIAFDYLGHGAIVQLQSMESPASHPVLTASIPTSTQWQHQRIAVDSTYAGLNRLFFKRLGDACSNLAGAVDNLEVKASACPPPTPLSSELTLPNAVRIMWDNIADGSYQVACKVQGDSAYTELEVNDTVVVIPDLQFDKLYFWKVRAHCDGAYGEWSSEYSFKTMPQLPYTGDFEDAEEVANWMCGPYDEWNYWNISAAPMDNGNTTLHVACEAWGQGNYNYYAAANLWAYRDIYLPNTGSKCQISFDYRGVGENGVDFARIYLGPPVTPSGSAVPENAEQIGGNFCMIPVWTHYSFEVDTTHTGMQRIYFLWHCNNVLGVNPGGAFDNISIQMSDCAIPTNLATDTVEATTATLSWEPGDTNAQPTSYTVAYRLISDSIFTEVNCTGTTIQVAGLQPDQNYYWRVRANCSETEHSLWSNSGYFVTPQQAYAHLPYECGFEDVEENLSWSHHHLKGANEWVIGTATAFEGDSALYVSYNNGATNTYTNATISTDWFYRDLYFPPGYDEYEISFDFKGKGSSYHYARVFLGRPEMILEDFMPEDAELLGSSLYNITDWQHFTFHLSNSHSGLQRLYILWQNNTYSLAQPPAAIDNIVISAQPCSEPVNLNSEAASDYVTLSWSMRFGISQADYTVAYHSQNDSIYTYVNVSDTFLILQDLDSNTYYYWKVRQNCDTSCSIWSDNGMFYTNEQVICFFDFDSPDSSSSWIHPQVRGANQWYAGRLSESPYNGTLYVSSDGGQNNIYDINEASNSWAYSDVCIPDGSDTTYFSFDFKGMGETNHDFLNVYIAPPAIPSGNSAPAGAIAFEKIGMDENWTHYNFAINNTHTGTQRIYLLWHNDQSGGTNPPASIDNICLSREPLPLMSVIVATAYDTTAHLSWDCTALGNPTSYTVSYAELTMNTATEITVLSPTCDLSGLLPNTDYFCKVRANYSNGIFSTWSGTQFHTLAPFSTAPLHCDFEIEAENGNWQFASDNTETQWVIDTAVTHGGNKSVYISNNNGRSNEYSFYSETNAWAYRNLYLDPTQAPYVLSFDYRGGGERTTTQMYDYAAVFIGLPTVFPVRVSEPEWVQLDDTLCLQSEWATHEVIIDAENTGYVSLLLYWHNDNFFGTNPAGSFDNISITPYECVPPMTIVADSITSSVVSFSFIDTIPYHHDWDVTIAANDNSIDETNAVMLHDESSFTFTDLESNSQYTIYVRTHCSDVAASEWASLSFATDSDHTISVADYSLDYAIRVYPNPSSQYVDVLCKDDINISEIEVYDSYGRRSIHTKVYENPKRISVSRLAPGLYLMRVITDCGAVSKTFIKR